MIAKTNVAAHIVAHLWPYRASLQADRITLAGHRRWSIGAIHCQLLVCGAGKWQRAFALPLNHTRVACHLIGCVSVRQNAMSMRNRAQLSIAYGRRCAGALLPSTTTSQVTSSRGSSRLIADQPSRHIHHYHALCIEHCLPALLQCVL